MKAAFACISHDRNRCQFAFEHVLPAHLFCRYGQPRILRSAARTPEMNRVYVILGPTAAGKSEFALELAERCGAEIINVDAFQIYKGFDLLTTKPNPRQLVRAPHHLISLLPLSAPSDVFQYCRLARAAVADIWKRGHPAILVGGSGFYMHAILHGISPLPPPDPAVRAEFENQGLADLVDQLRKIDPETAKTIDLKNKRRLVRALEVCKITGKKYSLLVDRSIYFNPSNTQSDPIFKEARLTGIYLNWSRADLHERIRHRAECMFAAGVLDEVRSIPEDDVGPTAKQILGLATARRCIRGEIAEPGCREIIETSTRQYAKRQITWFKKFRDFTQVTLSEPISLASTADRLLNSSEAKATALGDGERPRG